MNNSEFFIHYFQQDSVQTHLEFLMKCCKPFTSKSLQKSKSTKQLGFFKKYTQICKLVPFICSPDHQCLQTSQLRGQITQIYHSYLQYFCSDLSKVKKLLEQNNQLHLQEYLLYRTFSKKWKDKARQKYLIHFMFTLNLLKTSNKELRLFSNFLANMENVENFLLYLVIWKLSHENNQKINKISYKRQSKILKAINQDYIFNLKRQDFQKSINQSIYSENKKQQNAKPKRQQQTQLSSVNEEDGIQIGHFYQSICNVLEGKKLSNITICKLMTILIRKFQSWDDVRKSQESEVKQFIETYFSKSQNKLYNILALQTAQKIQKLANKMFPYALNNQSCVNKNAFIDEATGCILEQLVMLFYHRQMEFNQEKQQYFDEMQTLKKSLRVTQQLYNYEVLSVSQFVELVLKQRYIYELVKKYRFMNDIL